MAKNRKVDNYAEIENTRFRRIEDFVKPGVKKYHSLEKPFSKG